MIDKSLRPIQTTRNLEPLINYISDLVGIDITSPNRVSEATYGRMVLYRIVLNHMNISLDDLGSALNRHRATVINGFRQCEYLTNQGKWEWIYKSALEYLYDLEYYSSIEEADGKGQIIAVMTERIQEKQDIIDMITEGREYGPYEDHEIKYRELTREQQENFRERVNVMLKMYK